MVISNIDDGTILDTNDTFLTLTGFTREEVINIKSAELGTEEIVEVFYKVFNPGEVEGKIKLE